jgi:DNA-binding response OmpR family regulator
MACSERILIVDGDASARAFLADNLTADGFEVMTAATVRGAGQLLASTVVDLIVTELDLADADGLELVAAVRNADRLGARVDPGLPIVVLSARDGEHDRVRGFERGCDDYLGKPYSYAELRGRLQALLRRRARVAAGARTRVGPLELDAVSRQVWLDGDTVSLSNKEFSLLRVLAAEPARVFTRSELLQAVWGWSDEFGSRALDAHICRLRRKLRERGAGFIVNVWGVGYRLIDAVGTPAVV